MAKREESKAKQMKINVTETANNPLIAFDGTRTALLPTTKEVAMIECKEVSKEDIAHRIGSTISILRKWGCEPGKDVEDWVSAESSQASSRTSHQQKGGLHIQANSIDVKRKGGRTFVLHIHPICC